MIGPEDPEQFEKTEYDTNECGCNVAVDLNWIFNKFLGVLFAPDEFRVRQDLCQDGCISKKNLLSLFEKYNIDFDLLIKLLDYYEVNVYSNCNISLHCEE